jgi:hypothetical protein
MDKLDQKLSKDPDLYLPDVFAQRIRMGFRRKYHFRQRMLVLSALLLIIAGFYAVFPEVASLNGQLNGQSATLYSVPAADLPLSLQTSATGLWQGMTDLQDSILVALNLPAWLGLFSVAIGSVIGIGGIFPHLRTR